MLRTNVIKVHFLLEVEFRWGFFDGVFLFVFFNYWCACTCSVIEKVSEFLSDQCERASSF